jgi:SAM-dependent methyltransferase
MDQVGGYQQLAPREVLPWFDERQQKAIKALFDFLIPKIRSGAIDRIVDLGCGTGEILVGLAQELTLDPRGGACVELLGLDSDLASVEEAQERRQKVTLPSEVSCTFVHCKETDNFLEALGTESNRDACTARGSTTAVLCLGHTIFHLPYLPEIFSRLISRPTERPALWLVDVYHSWDSVLSGLENGLPQVDEPRSYSVDQYGARWLHVLFTRKMEAEPAKVARGLVSRRDNEGSQDDRDFETHQFAWPTAELVARFAEARYWMADRAPATTGYGEMERLVFQCSERMFALPALFLDSKTVPRRLASDDYAEPGAPIGVLAQWIYDSGLIGIRPGRGFDFVMVEVAPYYNCHEGLKALRQEVLLCTRRGALSTEQMRAITGAYARQLQGFLSNGLSPFFHPEFSGYCGGVHWPPIHYSLRSSDDGPELAVEAATGEKLEGWRHQLLHSLNDPGERAHSEASVVSIGNDEKGVDCLMEFYEVGTLVSEEVQEKIEKHKLRARLNLSPTSGLCDESDLGHIQDLLHERTRGAFQSVPGIARAKTVFMGIPLRLTLDAEIGDAPFPDRFRGGAWIFAGVSGEYLTQENTLLGDLARLIVMLQIPAIDAKAASASIRRFEKAKEEAEKNYNDAQKNWMERTANVRSVFDPKDSWHEVWEWLQAAPEEREKRAVHYQVRETARKLINSQYILKESTEKLSHIDLHDALVLLKAASKGGLSAWAALEILRCGEGHTESTVRPGNQSWLIPRNGECGSLARALYEFAVSSKDNKEIVGVRKSLRLVEIASGKDVDNIWRVRFDTVFSTNAAAVSAKNLLQKTLRERIASRPDKGGGRGGTARHFLLKACHRASDPAFVAQGSPFDELNPPIEMIDDRSFRLEFDFKSGECE